MSKGTVKDLSNMEIDIMIEGTVKVIEELKDESKNGYPEVVLTAIRNDIEGRYKWYDELINERNRRLSVV